MNKAMRERIEASGFRLGTVQELLGLSDEEAALVEIRVSAAMKIRRLRKASGVSQAAVARKAKTSQSRVAKAENASAEVSMDLFLRVLVAAGADPRKIAKAMAA